LLTVYIIYQYLLNTSKQVVVKWGTFVEGIFDTTSFLPYLRNDQQSLFYQGLLFNGCLSHEYSSEEVVYNDNLCHVTTQDYKNYYISLISWHTWSDGVPVSLDDIFFSYNDVLSHNIWNIPALNKYGEIEVSQSNDGKLKVVFSQASIDNTLFFTNYVLPRHALFSADLTNYQKDFSITPVYTNCAHIMPQSTDQYSLVFDLSNCEDSYLWFYQIKNAISFEDFENAVSLNGSIIDAYLGPTALSGYNQKYLLSNKMAAIFFNTKSQKTRVRIRRALGGLIVNNFFTGDYNNYLQRYNDPLFNNFLSTGGNIQDFLTRASSNQILSKGDLEDVGVISLPSKVSITWTEQKLVYYIENISNKFPLYLSFDKKYNKISIRHNDGAEYIPKSYSSSKRTAKYNIGPGVDNLNPGINKYTIYGFAGKEKKVVATIDLYNLNWEISAEDLPTQQNEQKLIVLYYRNPTSLFVVEQLQKIFGIYDILWHFSFQGFDDPDEFEWRLSMGDYDLVINTIDMGFKKDISKLFKTDKAQINHSQYTNQRFVSLLEQYLWAKHTQKDNMILQINGIYETDLPFVMLGTIYTPLYIKDEVFQVLPEDIELHEHNRRSILYKELRLVKNINIDMKNTWGLWGFLKFVFDNLKNKSLLDIEELPIETER